MIDGRRRCCDWRAVLVARPHLQQKHKTRAHSVTSSQTPLWIALLCVVRVGLHRVTRAEGTSTATVARWICSGLNIVCRSDFKRPEEAKKSFENELLSQASRLLSRFASHVDTSDFLHRNCVRGNHNLWTLWRGLHHSNLWTKGKIFRGRSGYKCWGRYRAGNFKFVLVSYRTHSQSLHSAQHTELPIHQKIKIYF